MKVFDEGTIKSFAVSVDYEIIENALNSLNIIIDNALSDIKKNNAFLVGNCEILPINEFYNGAVSPNSTLDVLLILTSSQLEFNTVKFNKNKFKNFWNKIKYAWKHRKDDSRRSRRSRRRKQKQVKKIEIVLKDKTKYDMYEFKQDLLNSIVNYISPTTICSIESGVIKINGESLPFKTRIFPVINKFGSYNYFLERKNKFINLDFKDRFKIINEMTENYGEKYLAILRIFNALYFNIYNTSPNQIFIESLIFNLPREAFLKKSDYETFVFAVNYFININLNNLKSCVDPTKKIYEDTLSGISLINIVDFFNNLKKFLK